MRFHETLIGAIALLGSATAFPNICFGEYDHCGKCDLLFNCFNDRAYYKSASAYCAGLTTTKTVATVTGTSTVTVSAIQTAPAVTDTITEMTTIASATVPATTTTTTRTVTQKLAFKREPLLGIFFGPPPPRCMTSGTSYPASRATAACSCIGVHPQHTDKVTYTHCVSTKTVTATATVTPTVSTTETETAYVTATEGIFTTTFTFTTVTVETGAP